jgi:hypothetical protein
MSAATGLFGFWSRRGLRTLTTDTFVYTHSHMASFWEERAHSIILFLKSGHVGHEAIPLASLNRTVSLCLVA